MNTEKKREFLINTAYWVLVAAMGYLFCAYLVPVIIPFIIGGMVARLVVGISRKLRCPQKWMRILLTLLIYGCVGGLVALAVARAVSGLSGLVAWLPEFYKLKLLPFGELCYDGLTGVLENMNPAMVKALEFGWDNLSAALKNLISVLSTMAVNLVSGVAKGVPKLLLSLLAMIFSTVFVSNDYEHLRSFTAEHTPENAKGFLKSLKKYLTDTLFVVLRSYGFIMLLTFTELFVLFAVFGIEDPVTKAAVIAVLDIMPILGVGTVLIPWAIISLVLGYTRLGIELLVIYGIVTVVRNYAEPKIVGAQLGLHPIISLVSMFVGLRLFGFWGMFGLPIGISFFWKLRQETADGLPEKDTH